MLCCRVSLSQPASCSLSFAKACLKQPESDNSILCISPVQCIELMSLATDGIFPTDCINPCFLWAAACDIVDPWRPHANK